MKGLKKLFVVLCSVLSLVTFAACNKTDKDLVLSADKTVALRNEIVTLSAVYENSKGETFEAEDVVYEIVGGSEFATISENLLTIKNNAQAGAVVKVQAKVNDKTSNEVKITVSVPLTGLTISAGGKGNVIAGGSVTFTKILNPELSDVKKEDVQWVIEQGESICSFAGDILLVDAEAATGAKIKVKAQSGTIVSNTITLTVGYPLEEITVNVIGSTNIKNGSSRALNVNLSPSNATDANISWVFTQGEDYAVIINNVIMIDEEAPIGSVIKFKAVSGTIESEEITVVVGTPIESISITASGFGSEEIKVLTSNTAILNAAVTPNGASAQGIEWVATEGANHVDFSGNTLVVKSGTPYGTTIKVKAQSGSVVSQNELVFQYGVAVSSIEISASSLNVVKGNTAILSAEVNQDATDESVLYYITEGSEFGKIMGNTLVVNQDATTGATIKVKAKASVLAGGFDNSNELIFTVMQTKEEENASKFMISVSDDKLKLDSNDTTSLPVLEVEVYDRNFNEVTDRTITYTLVEGEDFVDITVNGFNCSFEVKGHGRAVLEVAILGTEVKEQVEIQAIMPPEAVLVPEVFRERAGFVYNFSKVKPRTGEIETLPFVGSVLGTNVCEDLKYTFMHEDGTSGDVVATYNEGAITFNKTGKVTVIVSSDSGSKVETTTSYAFNINEGYNVYTFEELQALAIKSYYNGQEINIVVLEKADSSALENYTYGYDLVSLAGLKAKGDQEFNEVFTAKGGRANGQRINFVCKSVHLNGNKHKIDLSQVRAITKKEIADLIASDNTFPSSWVNFSSVISIIPWSQDEEEILEGSHQVKIYDLEVIGNSPVDYDGEFDGIRPFGTMGNGISIGSLHQYKTHYYVDMKNVKVSKCRTGVILSHVVGNGLVENLNIYNCFASGMELNASVVRLKDLTFGSCGAFCIEMTAWNSDKAGVNADEKQTVTFEGDMNVENAKNPGNTKYFINYKLNGYSIPEILTMQLQPYYEKNSPELMSHFLDEQGNFGFVSYMLADMSALPLVTPNSTVCNYPAYQEGGIIKATDLPTDSINTTHQYIEFEVDLTAFGLGKVGNVLLYNNNYGKVVEEPAQN